MCPPDDDEVVLPDPFLLRLVVRNDDDQLFTSALDLRFHTSLLYSSALSLTLSQLPSQPASMPPARRAASFCQGRKPTKRKPQSSDAEGARKWRAAKKASRTSGMGAISARDGLGRSL